MKGGRTEDERSELGEAARFCCAGGWGGGGSLSLTVGPGITPTRDTRPGLTGSSWGLNRCSLLRGYQRRERSEATLGTSGRERAAHVWVLLAAPLHFKKLGSTQVIRQHN